MALGYPAPTNPPFSDLGAGSVMLGTFLDPALGQAWEREVNFLPFAAQLFPQEGQNPLMQMGKGETYRYSITEPLPITGASLTTGTRTPTGTTPIIQTDAQVTEHGEGMNIANRLLQLTNESFNPASINGSYQAQNASVSLSNWMVGNADYKFGETLLTTTRFISINGTTGNDVFIGTAQEGTSYLTQAALLNLSAQLRALPIKPRSELGNTFAIVGPAGAFDHIKVIDNFQDNAARLQLSEFFRSNIIGAWQGFSFFELMGPSANSLMSLAGSATVGTCLLLADQCAVHDDSIDNSIGDATATDGSKTFAWYNDYGQDNGRMKRVQVNFNAVNALAVANGNDDYSRVFKLLSYQG